MKCIQEPCVLLLYFKQLCLPAKMLQLCPTFCDPMDHRLTGSSCPWDSPGKDTGVGCHFLLQGNLPDLGIKCMRLTCTELGGRLFTPGEPMCNLTTSSNSSRPLQHWAATNIFCLNTVAYSEHFI